MKHKIKFIIQFFCLIAISNYLFSQTTGTPLPVCPCSGQLCVTTEQELYDALFVYIPQPGDVITVCGTIYLGDIDPVTLAHQFPWEIPAYVTIQGDYDMGLATGSRIVFPFRYRNSRKCGQTQIADPNQLIPNANSDKQNDDFGGTNPTTASTSHLAFAFAMQSGSQFNNICLQGPKSDIREEFMMFGYDNYPTCSAPAPPATLDPLEGSVGGILIRGDDVHLNNSEVYGFPTYNLHIRPESDQWGNIDPFGLGIIKIDQCFIHNSKIYGWGYGIYGSGGSTGNCSDPMPLLCSSDPLDHLQNASHTSEIINVTNTMFMENGKDVDASTNRYSFNIDHCSMGLRNEFRIVDQHYTKHVFICNPYIQTDALKCTGVNQEQCFSKIHETGGESFSITHSFFFKGISEFWFNYPNTYTPTNPGTSCTGTTPFAANNPLLTLSGNIFLGNTILPSGRVYIADGEHHKWLSQHFKWYFNPVGSSQPIDRGTPLNTLWVTGVAPNYSFMEINQFKFFNDVTVPGIPHVTIGADGPNACDRHPYRPDVDEHNIFQGDLLCFNTQNCLDANLNTSIPGNSMRYLWRFHEKPNDLDDEIRTLHITTLLNTFTHTFSNIGITNVNLIGIDMNTHTMSYIATHQVTVKPPPADHALHLVFNIKDTYDGPWEQDVSGAGTCWIDKKKVTLPPGAALPTSTPQPCPLPGGICPGDGLDHTATGFEKYVKINGHVIWSQDIAFDDGGWQRIEYPDPTHIAPPDPPLENFLCTDDPSPGNAPGLAPVTCTSPTQITNDNIEIGIRAVSNVAAIQVRGVTLYIDDVYINSLDGFGTNPQGTTTHYNENILVNGDFEDYSNFASDWHPYIIGNNNVTSACSSPTLWPTGSNNTAKLMSEEVRSGIYSFWARIAGPDRVSVNNIPYLAADVIYKTSGSTDVTYASINQSFNFHYPPPRLANPADSLQENISFTIKPNPSASGTTIQGMFDQLPPKESYKINVLSPSGNLIYSSNGTGKYFTLNKILEPGIYYISVHSNDFTGYRKVVVVN